MLQLRDFTCIDPSGRRIWTDLNADFAPGELVAIAGPVGSGKTTLLEAICGLVPEFWSLEVQGTRVLDSISMNGVKPHETASRISFVGQDPTLGFVAQKVRDEIAFGPAQLGLSGAELDARVLEVARGLSIDELLERKVLELSGGEKQLVAIAAAVASGCEYLLLDEPTSRLDEHNTKRVLDLLRKLADDRKICVILSTHEEKTSRVKFDKIVRMHHAPNAMHEFEKSQPLNRLQLSRIFDLGEIQVAAGEIVAVTGVNGIGKTRLLESCYDSSASSIEVVMVPQEPADLLMFETVQQELADADSVSDSEPGTALNRLLDLGFDLPLQAHPRDLSAGQKLGLALALQLSRKAEVLLLDEPNRGLDQGTLALLRKLLATLARAGTAIVIVSHDRKFLGGLIDRELRLTEVGLKQVQP